MNTLNPLQPSSDLSQLEQTSTTKRQWLWYRLISRRLKRLKHGRLQVVSAFGRAEFGEESDISVTLVVKDTQVFGQLVFNGMLGAAEIYMQGGWECDDLVALVRLLVRNRDLLDNLDTSSLNPGAALWRGWHALKRNSRRGSRANIAAHYDLGNDFFAQFLDHDWMLYSSGLFHQDTDSLEAAQEQKLQRLCDKLQLTPDDHLLEIGTGWGGCAIFAAKHYGCRVTTTTLSRKQYEYAKKQVSEAGLDEYVTLLLKDYRDLEGTFDKLISIEMVEAVGHQFLPGFFQQCQALLAPNGLAAFQAITIQDHHYSQALQRVDFIKRYIFPGSFIPCVSVLTSQAAESRLRLVNLEDIGDSYALTLCHWRQRFLTKLDAIRQLGYDERFIRMWLFYFCYCEGGFRERSISDVQMVFAAREHASASWLPVGGNSHGQSD